MLAFRLRDGYLDQLFVAPEYHGRGIGKMLLQFTRKQLPDEIWLRCASANEKGMALVRARRFRVRERRLAFARLADALLSLEEGICRNDEALLGSAHARRHHRLDDGGNGPAI